MDEVTRRVKRLARFSLTSASTGESMETRTQVIPRRRVPPPWRFNHRAVPIAQISGALVLVACWRGPDVSPSTSLGSCSSTDDDPRTGAAAEVEVHFNRSAGQFPTGIAV